MTIEEASFAISDMGLNFDKAPPALETELVEDADRIARLLILTTSAGMEEEDDARQEEIANAHVELVQALLEMPSLAGEVIVTLSTEVVVMWLLFTALAEAQATTTDALMIQAGFSKRD